MLPKQKKTEHFACRQLHCEIASINFIVPAKPFRLSSLDIIISLFFSNHENVRNAHKPVINIPNKISS